MNELHCENIKTFSCLFITSITRFTIVFNFDELLLNLASNLGIKSNGISIYLLKSGKSVKSFLHVGHLGVSDKNNLSVHS